MADAIRDRMSRLIRTTITSFNTREFNAIRATRSDDFVHIALPATLGLPPRVHEVYAEYLREQTSLTFQRFNANLESTVHDVEQRRSVVFATLQVEANGEPANIEVCMAFSFDEAVERVTRIDEFFDSLSMTELQQRVRVDGGVER